MKIAVCQHDFPVGDVAGNVRKVIALSRQAAEQGADLAVFPELTLAGYPPEDLVQRAGFISACQDGLAAICHAAPDIDLLVGLPLEQEGALYNALVWIREGKVIGTKRKEVLPNYAVFDEKRYFQSAPDVLVVEHCGVRCGVLVCEDLWIPGPAQRLERAGADLIISSNASPYHCEKWDRRADLFRERCAETSLPVLYLNVVGGQDELVFDGSSCQVDANGEIVACGPSFEDAVLYWTFSGDRLAWHGEGCARDPDLLGLDYRAMVRGTRDYVRKNGFEDVVLGLSGGIDSALVLAIAVDALGPEHVHAVMLPSRYTSQLSLELAAEQANLLGVSYQTIDIEAPFQGFTQALEQPFTGHKADVTEENLQSRCRGVILMALSNKLGYMLLTTGNKSEYAVGYATIYGDMCGGFAPIKDCSKTRVFELCRWLNREQLRIAPGIIERPPTAELREDQKDSDSLPPYPVLDDIISRYVEHDEPRGDIIDSGHDAETVDRVIALIHMNEWKRRQSAPGVRITPRAFGRDRRYPITNRYR